jgi:hypothetical protein
VGTVFAPNITCRKIINAQDILITHIRRIAVIAVIAGKILTVSHLGVTGVDQYYVMTADYRRITNVK